MKSTKKTKWTARLIFVLLAVLIVCAAIVSIYMAVQYNTAFEPIQIIDRPDSFVMPEYPGLDETPPDEEETEFSGTGELPGVSESTETTAPETTAPVTESTETTAPETTAPVTESAETTAPETTAPVTEPAETTAPETTAPVTGKPPETVAVTTAPVTQRPETAAPSVTTKAPSQTQQTTDKTPQKWSVYIRDPIYSVKQIDSNIINILLLGVDSREALNDRGRSDAMMVLSYNKKTGGIKLISFLRDALVPIEGHDWNRLNTAYTFGGAGMAVNTFNQLFGLDIQYYVAINFGGVEKMLDKIGPLDIYLTKAEVELYHAYGKTYLQPGINSLNAKDVHMHMANRTSDNDFGRTRRQRDVVIAITQKLLKEKNLGEILDIIEYGATIVGTNIDMKTMISLATSVVSQKDSLSIDTHNVPFADSYTFAWYKKMAILSFDIQDAAERVKEILYKN